MTWYPKFHELCFVTPDGEDINCCDGVNPRSQGRFVDEDSILRVAVEDNELYAYLKTSLSEKRYSLTLCELCNANLIEKLLNRIKDGI